MRHNLEYLNYRFTGSVIFALLFFVAGCDNLKLFNPKKTTPSKPFVSVAVKGTPIAKVNNTTLVLEDLDQEVEAYKYHGSGREAGAKDCHERTKSKLFEK
jgi:hypothetical protein